MFKQFWYLVQPLPAFTFLFVLQLEDSKWKNREIWSKSYLPCMFFWFCDIFSLIVRIKSGFIWVRGIECETFTLWGRKLLEKEKNVKNYVWCTSGQREKKSKRIKDISIFCTICRESWLANIKNDKKICIFCAYFTWFTPYT